MFKRGDLVKLKDKPYSAVDALPFKDRETFGMYFGFKGTIVGMSGGKVLVVFSREIEEIDVDLLEKIYESKERYGIFIDEGNGHIKVEVFSTLEEAQNRANDLEYGIVTILDEVKVYD